MIAVVAAAIFFGCIAFIGTAGKPFCLRRRNAGGRWASPR